MKIAMIGHKRVPSREGGVEICVEEISDRLVRYGETVDIYNRNRSENQDRYYHGARLINIPTINKKSLDASVYSLLASIRVLFGKYKVIHYHALGPSVMLWIPHLFHIKTVATVHGLDWKRAKWNRFAKWYLLLGEKVIAKYADEVIVLSVNNQEYFKKKYNRETVYIANGVNEATIVSANIIEQKYKLKKDEYILFLARIVPEKGLHYLIDAYKQCNTNKKLVICGGSSHTDKYYEEMIAKVEGEPNIIMTGFVEGRELKEFYSNAYLYVLPSEIEGMPLSLLEAMSYGNCCLVSNIKENVETIKENGISFETQNVESLREQLQRLLDHPEIVNQYKSQAKEYVTKYYSWDKTAKNTEKIYHEVIGE